MYMQSSRWILVGVLFAFLMSTCYNQPVDVQPVVMEYTEQQIDSLSFAHTHHYSHNYNFLVQADSLMLLLQMPEEAVSNFPTDSFSIPKGDRLVVADIRILPNDSIDSVWVQLAHEEGMFGWVHEGEMLQQVVPDDPISQFISFFSNKHLLIFLVVFIVIIFVYGIRKLFKSHAYIVHFHDIDTFYPTLLALVVAASATFYSTIQMFAPETWEEFYFHPSLNPFSQPLLIALFLASVWAILITSMAAVDDTFRHLSFQDAVPYLLGLAGICAVNYIIFTITTMYYVGYLLLLVYVSLALWRYFHRTRSKYICGNCGMLLKKKGRCPRCGAINE